MRKMIKLESNDCPQCRLMDIMLNAAGVYADKVINIDDAPEAVDEYGIMGVPVLVFTDEEGNEVDRISGAKGVNPEIILEKLNQ